MAEQKKAEPAFTRSEHVSESTGQLFLMFHHCAQNFAVDDVMAASAEMCAHVIVSIAEGQEPAYFEAQLAHILMEIERSARMNRACVASPTDLPVKKN